MTFKSNFKNQKYCHDHSKSEATKLFAALYIQVQFVPDSIKFSHKKTSIRERTTTVYIASQFFLYLYIYIDQIY